MGLGRVRGFSLSDGSGLPNDTPSPKSVGPVKFRVYDASTCVFHKALPARSHCRRKHWKAKLSVEVL